MRTILKFFLAFAAASLFASASGAAETRAVLILDSTAQMNAKLGQYRKIEAVKNAVTASVSRLDPQAQLALWAFGTNPDKKCRDTSELLPLQPAETGLRALDKALGQLEPKAARTPIYNTLQAALEASGNPKDAGITAVLIAGTGDDCSREICAEAKALHSIYPNAKFSVLAIGMSEGPTNTFTCAAKAMGGEFTAVKSASELEKLLRQTLDIPAGAKPRAAGQTAPAPENHTAAAAPEKTAADQKTGTNENNVAAKEAEPAPEAPPVLIPEAKTPPAQAPQPEPNTVLGAVLANGSSPLDAGVTWDIYKVSITPTGQVRVAETPAWTAGGGQAQLKLPEGRYSVRASYGFAGAEETLTVNGGRTEKTVVLNAGTIAAEAFQAPGADAAQGVFFTLSRRKPDGTREELGRSSESPAIFLVNAGEYILQASCGIAKLESAVKIQAGRVSAVRMALNVGTLEIKTLAAEGAQNPVPAWHRIYPAASDAAKGAAPLLTIEGGVHRIQLPAGSYRLVTEYGNARTENAVTVTAGQTLSQTVTLGSGEAKLSFSSGKTAKVCEVYEAGAPRTGGPAGRAAGTSMSFILKAGLYDVECHAQGGTASAKAAQIRVVAGETQETKIED